VQTAIQSLLCVGLLSLAVSAAPVPPPIKVTEQQIVGGWHLEYCTNKNGSVVFNRDGSFVMTLKPDDDAIYHGTWYLNGNELVTQEWRFSKLSGTDAKIGKYVYTFDMRAYPKLTGMCNGHTKVTMTKHMEGKE
jgi:hypothetical protein